MTIPAHIASSNSSSPETNLSSDANSPVELARRGLFLVPVRKASKHLTEKSPGKNPGSYVGKGWQHKTSCEPAQIERWISEHPDSNWGLQLGNKSQVWDLEYDDEEGRDIIEDAIKALGGVKTPTYSSGKSVHRLFKIDERVVAMKTAVRKLRGTEWRFGDGERGVQSIIPPSVHLTGKNYEWLPGLSFAEVEPIPVPEELLELYARLGAEEKGDRKEPSEEEKAARAALPAREKKNAEGEYLSHVDAASDHMEENKTWYDLLLDMGWSPTEDETIWSRPGDYGNAKSAELGSYEGAPVRLTIWTNGADIPGGTSCGKSLYSKFRFWWMSKKFSGPIEAAKAYLEENVGSERVKQITAAYLTYAAAERAAKSFEETPHVPKPAGPGQQAGPAPQAEPANEAEAWDDILELSDTDLPSLTQEMMPPKLGQMAKAISDATETPFDIAALSTLATVSATCMQKYEIEVTPGYTESANLYCVAVADPGSRKSAVFKMATDAILKLQSEKKRVADDYNIACKTEVSIWKKRNEHLQNAAAKAKTADQYQEHMTELRDHEVLKPIVMLPPQYVGGDASPEGLEMAMVDNNECMFVATPEATPFEIITGRYSGKANTDLYAQAYDGEHRAVTRTTRSLTLNHPLLTLLTMIQPNALSDLGACEQIRGRGILARLSFVIPETNVGSRQLETVPVPESVRASYESTVLSLMNTQVLLNEDRIPQARTVLLSPAAQALWHGFAASIEERMSDQGDLCMAKDLGGKTAGRAARIALAFHCFNAEATGGTPDATTVSADTMQMAVNYTLVLVEHAKAAYEMASVDPVVQSAKKVLRKLRERKETETTVRDLMRFDRTKETKADFDPTIRLLVDHNYLRPQKKEKKQGRPSKGFEVNPALWEA